MNWEFAQNLLFGLGLFTLAVGLLLRFKAGRRLLDVILVLIMLGALLGGEPSALDSDFGTADPFETSRYWLGGSALCVLTALVTNLLIKY